MIYDELYKKFYPRIVNYIFCRIQDKFHSEGIANATFDLLRERWDSLSFKHENAVLTWLYSVAAKKIYEHRRKNQNQYIPLDSEYMRNIADPTAAVDYVEIDDYQEEQKFREYVSEIRSRLEGDDLKLFDMKMVSKFTYEQIAAEFSTTAAAVKMRWYRMQRRLLPIVNEITKDNL